MARRGFNRNQRRDSHGRWTKSNASAGSKVGAKAKAVGKFLFVPQRPVAPGGKPLTNKQAALRVAVAFAPLVLPIAFQGVGKLDTLIQSATQSKFASNAANYERAKRAATLGLKVGQSSLKFASKGRGGVYNISSMSGKKV